MKSHAEIEADFRKVMNASGIDYEGPLILNGKLHRIRAEKDRNRNSWYVLHPDPPAAGAFGCWKRAIKEIWCSQKEDTVSKPDWDRLKEKWRNAELQRNQNEQRRHSAARRIVDYLRRSGAPVEKHPYLEKKHVKATGCMVIHNNRLVLPLEDIDGQFWSAQFIDAQGTKRFQEGGRVSGCYFSLNEKKDGPLVIAEGFATGASITEATGYATIAAMNCGNLLPVAQALRKRWPRREIIIAADNDQWIEKNPGVNKAIEAAKAIFGKLAVPKFQNHATKPTDFNDLHALAGLEAVKEQIAASTFPAESDDELFERLAKLTPAEYDRCRDFVAEERDIRVTTLDQEVKKRQKRPDLPDSGHRIDFPELRPWDEPVNLAKLLDEIVNILRRYVIASDSNLKACALFAMHTYAFDLGLVSPLLIIRSPTKRCGKSRLLMLLEKLVNRPLVASSATAAGIYHTIASHRPTLLIDETDTFLKGDELLRGLLNAGHTRRTAFVLTCIKVGDKIEPRQWSTWCPKVLSGIGRLPDTVEDRAIIIELRRRKHDEHVERLKLDLEFEEVKRKALRWVADHTERIKCSDPQPPDGLHDRALDNWTPLFTLADLAGRDWPQEARRVAIELSGKDDSEGQAVLLLKDIRTVFNETCGDRISSFDLCTKLAEMEGHPWVEYRGVGRSITATQLARQLRHFGIAPRSVRIGHETPKGYHVEQFDEAFERYLQQAAPAGDSTNATPPQLPVDGTTEPFSPCATTPTVAAPEKALAAANHGHCGGVAVQNPEQQEELIL